MALFGKREIVFKTVGDKPRWQCEKCGEPNENSYAGAPRGTCAKCGAKRPGNPSDWYKI